MGFCSTRIYILCGLDSNSWRGLAFRCLAGMEMVFFGCFARFNGCGRLWLMVAWDMTDFRQRLISMAKDDNTRGIERRHLLRISLLTLLGLFLASVTMLVRMQFTFEWSALLVIVTLLGLGQLVGWLKR
jgi:hypothetical protein